MKTTYRFVAVTILLVIVMTACPSGRSVSIDVTGHWDGMSENSVYGLGFAEMTIIQDGNTLSGTFSLIYATGEAGGTLEGTISGSRVEVILEPISPEVCASVVIGHVAGDEFSGTFETIDCDVPQDGTLELTRDTES